jgi:hypothetical protein
MRRTMDSTRDAKTERPIDEEIRGELKTDY